MDDMICAPKTCAYVCMSIQICAPKTFAYVRQGGVLSVTSVVTPEAQHKPLNPAGGSVDTANKHFIANKILKDTLMPLFVMEHWQSQLEADRAAAPTHTAFKGEGHGGNTCNGHQDGL
eukprot:GHVS01087718.1.p1 GENE.GHVS01087718.1~~GHVS01087718.1.p1  ORF type:complete len:118 (+),score=8.23 GHVS01087718.1:211-564(+)